MGKLNIAHHKSYHPYRRDNIERVRKDEEEARKKEAVEEGRMMLADSEARIDLLRQRAGLGTTAEPQSKQRENEDTPVPQAGPSSLTTSGGHINLFEDLERQSLPIMIRTTNKKAEETDKGVPLAPLEKDLKPWYSDRNHERNRELEDDRKLRDLARKSVHDPLTSINSQLTSRSADKDATSSRRFRVPQRRPRSPSNAASSRPPEVAERITRESSERQRALELIRRKKRELAGSETPSTVHGGMEGGYGDVFNRKEVEEAHRFRERRWDKYDDHGRDGRAIQRR